MLYFCPYHIQWECKSRELALSWGLCWHFYHWLLPSYLTGEFGWQSRRSSDRGKGCSELTHASICNRSALWVLKVVPMLGPLGWLASQCNKQGEGKRYDSILYGLNSCHGDTYTVSLYPLIILVPVCVVRNPSILHWYIYLKPILQLVVFMRLGLCSSSILHFNGLQYLRWLAKEFTSLELFHILSHFNHKCKCFSLGFYVTDERKVVHNCEVGRKCYMVLHFFHK